MHFQFNRLEAPRQTGNEHLAGSQPCYFEGRPEPINKLWPFNIDPDMDMDSHQLSALPDQSLRRGRALSLEGRVPLERGTLTSRTFHLPCLQTSTVESQEKRERRERSADKASYIPQTQALLCRT
ncbi:hypothetical protein SKAU_G00303780 [Synaphobranchus kaupii]|uniref:Uncharacterized protein n=1 Tax=Synaphobranchus kaupii TaxID=118154 RepID=A0A9Q1EW80_SYNKA|nr:hypothetical protein SKAU_G00303780 [Synaphobranchus kaupii]